MKAVLVGLDRGRGSGWQVDDSLDELERLAQTLDVDVVGRIAQKLSLPRVRTFVGSGKVEEVKETAKAAKVDVVIFDDELTPRQQVNLGEEFGDDVRIMDRTALILDIFAAHASTREGKLQVELATLEYELPRLRGKWSHLEAEKLGGGLGARFGMGESQLETDRRLARRRISELKRDLARVSKEREVQRARRVASGIFRVSLVGYTNAGKSTLLNALTGTNVLADDKLFATLDSTTRRYELTGGRELTLTDTVGFINKLPHSLVAAFKSTLEEVVEADLLLHVVDAAAGMREQQIAAVRQVLQELHAHEKPTLMVFNKTDLLTESSEVDSLRRSWPGCVLLSAGTGTGFGELVTAMEAQVARISSLMRVLIPYTRGDLVELAHKRSNILEERFEEDGTVMTLRVPPDLTKIFKPFALTEVSGDSAE
ncbi:MAG: GTPase HflX [Actinomycetes bacterium]|jgi:GTP-binding protein HflX|nr:GTPase HflX [Actinomycetes bacterium]